MGEEHFPFFGEHHMPWIARQQGHPYLIFEPSHLQTDGGLAAAQPLTRSREILGLYHRNKRSDQIEIKIHVPVSAMGHD